MLASTSSAAGNTISGSISFTLSESIIEPWKRILLFVGNTISCGVHKRPHTLDQVCRHRGGDVAVAAPNELPIQLCATLGRRTHFRNRA